jgi:pilus assembly protein CpaF
MSTGHDGSMSTVHANSPDEALRPLETLPLSGESRIELKTMEIEHQPVDRFHS